MTTPSLEQQLQNVPEVALSHSTVNYPDRTHQPGLPLLEIDNPHCRAVVALQGAQLLEFTPHGGDALLWLSPNAIFSPGKAIRGGIPVCLPWFGVNQHAPEQPKHGFARNRDWQLQHIATDPDGETRLGFGFEYNGTEPALFPYPFSARLSLRLSQQLELTLMVANTGTDTLPLSWALHSYHPVADLAATRVTGLDGCRYLDNTRGLAPAVQTGEVRFSGEIDRAYERVGRTQVIEGNPRIVINGENCNSAIVWNPGAELAAGIGDIGAGNYAGFVCVERGAAFGDARHLHAGERLTSQLTLTTG